MHVTIVPGQRRDARKVCHRRVVGGELPPPNLGVRTDLVELAQRDRGEHVGEVGLVARHGEVVEGAVPASHQAQVLQGLGDAVAIRRDQSAFARGDVLGRVERETRQVGD